MAHPPLQTFLRDTRAALARGPVAVIFAEDEVEIASTLRHHLDRGFRAIVLAAAPHVVLPSPLPPLVHAVTLDFGPENAVADALNAIMRAAPQIWLYYGFNAEYLFYPFCETRSVGEMTAFCLEERRHTVLTYVIDLYAADLGRFPDAVSLETAHLDRSGYYALARSLPEGGVAERQLDFFGGLRWRFEEHVPPARRRIDRVGLFLNKPGLVFRPDHTFSEAEYNTYACPWHHNVSAAICSFRTAKALKRNPGSTHAIGSFHWHNATPFRWHSQQLLDLGLMEPGQWF